MFKAQELETAIRNNAKTLAALKARGGVVAIPHNSAIVTKTLGESHVQELIQTADSLGVDLDAAGNTYAVSIKSDGTPRVYAPAIRLRKGEPHLRWGSVFVRLRDLTGREDLVVSPQALIDGDKARYSLVISLSDGTDLPFRLYMKDGQRPNTAQLTQALKTGQGWAEWLEEPYPTDLKTTVTERAKTFKFDAVKVRSVKKEGVSKAGKKYSINELVITSTDGDTYSIKDGNSRLAQDIRYWGTQMTEENPVQLTVHYEQPREWQGKLYPEVSIGFYPVHEDEQDLLADLLDDAGDYFNNPAYVGEHNGNPLFDTSDADNIDF